MSQAGFRCDLCAQHFDLETQLVAHTERRHFGGVEYGFQDGSSVTVVRSAQGQWNCPWCPSALTDADDLTDHLGDQHQAQITSLTQIASPTRPPDRSPSPTRLRAPDRSSPTSSSRRFQPYPGSVDRSPSRARPVGAGAPGQRPTPSALNTVDNPVLVKCGLTIETSHRALICPACKTCIWRSTAANHAHAVHRGSKLLPEEVTVLHALFDAYNVHSEPAEYPFPWGGPSIEGLLLVSQGYVCRPCTYACPKRRSMVNHVGGAEHRAKTRITIDDIEIAPIQAFFYLAHRKFFLVHPASNGLDRRNPYILYLEQYGDQVSGPMEALPEPTAAGEVPQLERITCWGSHLRQWIGTRTEVARLRGLIDTKFDGPLERVRVTCVEYLNKVTEVGLGSVYNVRSNLSECPKGSKPPWKILTDPGTIGNYAHFLAQFTAGLIRAQLGGLQTSYALPLTAAHRAAIRAYLATLSSETIDLDAFHAMLPPLFMAVEGAGPVMSKFEHALECLISIINLREEGNFREPRDVTPFLAGVKYLIRATILFEGYTVARRDQIPLEAAVHALCVRNIMRSCDSPFNSVTELQAFVTTLAHRAVLPPVTRVSPDGMYITYKHLTLSVAEQRSGLRLALAEAEKMLDDLCFQFPLRPEIPEHPQDDWGENRRGYSFVNNHTYIPSDSFWCHLLQSPEAGLTSTSADNKLTFVQPAVDRMLAQDALFQSLLAPLVFTSSSCARPAEFVDLKIKNSTRPRNLFMHGPDFWMVTRRMKWENLVGYEVFVPLLFSPPVAPLVLKYLLVHRPAVVRVLRITKGEAVARLYDEYLWVVDGRRVSTDLFSKLLEEFTRTHFKVTLSSRPHRHLQVEEYRVFLNSTADVAIDESEISSVSRGHRTSTATDVYSVEEGYLPRLSSDRLLQHRHFCLSWAEVLGLRPGFPPLMPFLLRQRLAERAAAGAPLDDRSPEPRARCGSADNLGGLLLDALQQMGIRLEESVRRSVAEGFVEVLSRHQLPERQPPPPADLLLGDGGAGPEIEIDDHHALAPQALQLLRQFYNDDAALFRSPQQREAVCAALECEVNFCACLPTGGGKSLVYALPAAFEEDRLTVVMCPNTALLRDQLARSEHLGLTCHTWTVEASRVSTAVQLAYVALESAVTDTFLGFVCAPENRVRRLVFDEIHQGLTESAYRPAFLDLLRLAPVAIQKIWLSATLPAAVMGPLWSLLGQPPSTRVIRAPMLQQNLEFHRVVVSRKVNAFVVELVRLLQSVEMRGDEQGLLFFRTKAEVVAFSDVAAEIGVVPSHADLPERVANEALWMDGASKWIAATGTLIHGIDNPRCKVVIFVGWDAGLLLFAQGWGRAGRNGQRALAFLVGPQASPREADGSDPDVHCFQQSAQYFSNTTECRRLILGLAFNGEARSCAQIAGAQRCDICNPLGHLTVEIRALLERLDLRGQRAPGAAAAAAALRPDQPSISILFDAAGAQCMERRKESILSQLQLLASALRGKCAACWGGTGQLSATHTLVPRNCDGGVKFDPFKRWRDHLGLPVGRYCFKCGLPNTKGCRVVGHPQYGCNSDFEDLYKHALYMIRHTPAVWEAVVLSFPHHGALSLDTDDVKYAKWVCASPRSFYNGLELIVWVWMARDLRARPAVE